ncbi:DUF427 domain-containing protein [Subtercola lobariae]|uniref:DUF427 domain-containing protein n=1 Tax=Subtercola lobariae TaxID=1588641 RepID=A0A917EWK7_9MICO|nr:DUF427 domain-containing protein [Subtercola lobariae]GGF22267.1 hypothetical protein GCM10011399_14920 [Subtercola lobariae]
MSLNTSSPTLIAPPAERLVSRRIDDLLVALAPAPGIVEIRTGETVVASTTRAVELHEVDIQVRFYIPREDVRLDLLRPIEGTTFCPFKGVASEYWALADDTTDTAVAWSYPEPNPSFAGIAGHIAFYDSLTLSVSQ